MPALDGTAHLKNAALLVRHPRLVPKLAADYVKVFAGRRVLRGVELCLTYRCNADCGHCLTKDLIDGSRAELSADEVVDAVRQISKLGAIFVNLTGGEPLMREDWFDIVSRCAEDRSVLITLATNGVALDGETARRLGEAGAAIVVFSLDGPGAEAHDESRGRAGAFAAVKDGVVNAKRAGMGVFLTAIATRENLADGTLAATADLAREWGCPLTLNMPYAVGRWAGRDIALRDEDMARFRALLRRRDVRWEGTSNFRREGCPAGDEKLYVTPYGDVMPCAVIHASFGNLLEEPLAAIYERIGRVGRFSTNDKPCLVGQDTDFLKREIPGLNQDPGKRPDHW